MAAKLIALGSPNGDDRAAWEAAALAGFPEAATDDPLAVLDASARPVVVDAVRGLGMPGSLHRLTWPNQQFEQLCRFSSHTTGLAEAFALAAALGRLQQGAVVLAIEIGESLMGEQLSPPVAAAIPELARMIREELESDG